MTPNEYQKEAFKTCTNESYSFEYLVTGLCSEAGEVAGKYAKWIRKGEFKPLEESDYYFPMLAELGDVMWFVATLAHRLGYNLESIMKENIKKLQSRQERGTIQGDGDER